MLEAKMPVFRISISNSDSFLVSVTIFLLYKFEARIRILGWLIHFNLFLKIFYKDAYNEL